MKLTVESHIVTNRVMRIILVAQNDKEEKKLSELIQSASATGVLPIHLTDLHSIEQSNAAR